MRDDRFPLGTMVEYLECACGGCPPKTCMVVGTWSFTGACGEPGTVETRRRRFRSDPQTDETAHGYLLLPSGDTGFILATFGAVHTGDLKRLF